MTEGTRPHIPVMLNEVVEVLKPQEGAVIVDGTFGAGGYSRALLEAGARVVALDRDRSTATAGAALQTLYPDRFTLIHRPFSELLEALNDADAGAVDGIVLDIGVSSMQLDQAARGFSFRQDGPLDMRMGEGATDAEEIVNSWDEPELAELFYKYGEERRSRAIARLICEVRQDWPIRTTRALANLIEKLTPQTRSKGRAPLHPATRTFQALRIAVNDELIELARALQASETALVSGGRLAVVTFQSLEDRIVKRFLADATGVHQTSRYAPLSEVEEATFALTHRRPLVASDSEVAANPRARSAKLRSAIRTPASSRSTQLDLSRAQRLGLPLISRDRRLLERSGHPAMRQTTGDRDAIV